jgi:monothiol glutaredoxin
MSKPRGIENLTYFARQLSPLRVTPAVTPRSLAIARRFITQEARQKIQGAIDATPVVLFMKGTPQQPQCGFSRAAIQVLELQGVPSEKLKTFDVLQDSELRSSIKEFSYALSRLSAC